MHTFSQQRPPWIVLFFSLIFAVEMAKAIDGDAPLTLTGHATGHSVVTAP